MNPEAQCEILSRGTEEILPDGELLARLRLAEREKRPLRVKQGFDPTAPDIHLGHTVGLRKLRQFQDFGHQVVLIVGDYTGMVGDPSGQSKTRPQLTEQQVNTNAQTYLDQFFRVLVRDPSPPLRPVEIHRNGEWFSKMSFMDVMKMASHYTVARMLERDDFAKRFEARQPISVHELFYPLMQGYDSVAIRSDVELGGTEQKFNLIVGRAMQELHGQLPQIVMTLPLLIGLDGVQRMSKSLGNYIGVTDAPGEMFGKIMSLPDDAMLSYWNNATGAPPEVIAEVRQKLADGSENPKTVKEDLAQRIVRLYHSQEAATRARENFETQFSKKGVPTDVEEFGPADVIRVSGPLTVPTIIEHIVGSGLASSKSAARRLVEQGAVEIRIDESGPGQRIRDIAYKPPKKYSVIRVGRKLKRFKA